MGKYVGITAALALIACIGVSSRFVELVLPEQSSAVLVAPAASGVKAPPLLLPLQCDAWIVQSGDGIATPRARCYHFKDRS
jgi:hypothetical protein